MLMYLVVAQSIIVVLVVVLVLIQAKGTGLGRGLSSQTYHSRRGVENLVFRACIVLTIVFVLLSVAQIFIN